MKYTLIGITGYAGSGKDSLAQMMVEKLGFERQAFADPMRKILYAMNPIVVADESGHFFRLQKIVDNVGWDRAKRDFKEIRQLLQAFGTEGGRDVLGQNIWVETLSDKYDGQKLVIPDVRFNNEARFIKMNEGIIIRIVRDGVGPVNDHKSEISYLEHDFTINNNGSLDDMFNALSKILFSDATLNSVS